MMTNWNDGSPADFLQFFEVTFPGMLARALMLSGNRHDAEDAVQDAYVEALRRWDRLATYNAPDAWVYLVVRQRLWKASGRWRRLSSLESMELTAWCSTDGSVEQAVEARAALAALAKLPHRQRTVMFMRAVADMAPHEIADELGITGNAVRQANLKARRTLEKMLGLPGAALVVPGRDTLASASRPASLNAGAQAEEDWLATTLREAWNWLREGIDANQRGWDRIRRGILARALRDRSR